MHCRLIDYSRARARGVFAKVGNIQSGNCHLTLYSFPAGVIAAQRALKMMRLYCKPGKLGYFLLFPLSNTLCSSKASIFPGVKTGQLKGYPLVYLLRASLADHHMARHIFCSKTDS